MGRSGFRDRFLVYAGRAPLNGHPHQELHLEPRPLEAAYAMLLHLAGVKTGSSGWIRTNTAALTERHPTVRSPRILKWWTRTVTLRLLPGANRSCDFHTPGPFEILAVRAGFAPATLRSTSGRSTKPS